MNFLLKKWINETKEVKTSLKWMSIISQIATLIYLVIFIVFVVLTNRSYQQDYVIYMIVAIIWSAFSSSAAVILFKHNQNPEDITKGYSLWVGTMLLLISIPIGTVAGIIGVFLLRKYRKQYRIFEEEIKKNPER